MSGIEDGVAEQVRSAIAAARAGGLGAVSAAELERILAEAASTQAPSAAETSALQIARFNATVEAGREALKAAVLINGGGSIALLSFLGAAVARGMPGSLGTALTWPLACFGVGVLLAASGFGLRYGAQVQYGRQRMTTGHTFNRSAIAAGILAYVAFALGVLLLFFSFRAQFAT